MLQRDSKESSKLMNISNYSHVASIGIQNDSIHSNQSKYEEYDFKSFK